MMDKQIEKIVEEMANEVCPNNVSELCASGRCSKLWECPFNIQTIEILAKQGYRKQEWISVEDRLPDEDEIVLVWDGKLAIARIRKGITEEQREKMRNGELPNNKEFCWSRTDGYHQIERSEIINQCDVWGNNLVPYCWEVYGGLSIMFGQDVYYWMPLPTPPKMKGADNEN